MRSGERIVITELWDARTQEVIDDTEREVEAGALAIDTVSMSPSWQGLREVGRNGPNAQEAALAVARARKRHEEASARLVDGVLSVAHQHGATAVDLRTRPGDRPGTMTITGVVVTFDDGDQLRVAGAGRSWDSFTQVVAEDLDPRAMEGLARDRRGRVDLEAWAQSTGRDQIDGQTYLNVGSPSS